MRRRDLCRLAVALLAPGLPAAGRTATAAPGPAPAPAHDHERTVFALFGDTPYDASQAAALAPALRAAAAESDFIVHVGDIKSGIELCSDELLAERLALLRGHGAPTVFVPGDNEWTDCHRWLAGSFDPAERLQRLRALAWDVPAREPDGLQRQWRDGTAWPEHQRWRAGPALFVTLNVPGSGNALQTRMPVSAHRDRADAAVAWLDEAAARAAAGRVPVLVVVLHAATDLHRLHPRDLEAATVDPENPYGWIRAALWRMVCRFEGRVLLLNGDRHTKVDEHPWRHAPHAAVAAARFGVERRQARRRMADFRRVQSFGAPVAGRYVRLSIGRATDGVRIEATDRGA